MAQTTRLTMTKLAEGQQQKEVTMNGSLEIIDAAMYKDMGEFIIASLPDATLNANAYALATDASGGRTVVRSDGTVWKVIAVEGATVA